METLMMTDPEGRRQVELASDNITRHIVDISGDIAEEEETNKRRREERTDQTTAAENLRSTSTNLPDEVPPSVRAAMFGKDAVPRKRRAEDDLDDPRSGVWQNVGDFENEDDVADLFGDFDHDAPNSGGAEASGSGTKRPADDEADDRGRGDDVDIVLPFECNH